jgi:hypothetical protein
MYAGLACHCTPQSEAAAEQVTRSDLTRPLEAWSSQRLHRVFMLVVLSLPVTVDPLDQRSGIRDTGETQRPPEGATPLCQRQARWVRVEMGTSTRQLSRRIGHEPGSATGRSSLARHRHNPQ